MGLHGFATYWALLACMQREDGDWSGGRGSYLQSIVEDIGSGGHCKDEQEQDEKAHFPVVGCHALRGVQDCAHQLTCIASSIFDGVHIVPSLEGGKQAPTDKVQRSAAPSNHVHLPWEVSKPVRSTTARQPLSGVRMRALLSPVCCRIFVPLKSTWFLSRLMLRRDSGSTCTTSLPSRNYNKDAFEAT